MDIRAPSTRSGTGDMTDQRTEQQAEVTSDDEQLLDTTSLIEDPGPEVPVLADPGAEEVARVSVVFEPSGKQLSLIHI